MCVKPLTDEYDACVRQLAVYTNTIASGHAPAITWLYRGGCLQMLRDLAGAARDYDRAIACGQELAAHELAQVYDSRNVCRRQLSDFAGAIADGEQAVLLHPEMARYFANLGFARMWAGDIATGIADLTHALELDPEEYWAVGYRGMCYQRIGEHERAIDDFSSLLFDPTASYFILLSRANSYVSLERFEEAIADCDAAAERAGEKDEDFRIYTLRGYCHFRLGNLDAALGDLARAVALGTNEAELYLWRGLIYRAIGDEQATTDDLTQFVTRHPGGPAAAFQRLANAMEISLSIELAESLASSNEFDA
jgi:tetratricopeptide (TPR) repeat protein